MHVIRGSFKQTVPYLFFALQPPVWLVQGPLQQEKYMHSYFIIEFLMKKYLKEVTVACVEIWTAL